MCSLNKINETIKIFNNLTNIGIIVTDVEGYIKYVNPFWLKKVNYTFEELIDKKISIFKSGFHDNNFYKNLWDTILLGNVYENIICNKSKDGNFIWQQIIIIPYFVDNKIENFIAFALDITEYRTNELKLKAILSSIPEVILVFDLETKICLDVYSDIAIKNFPKLKDYKNKTIEQLFGNHEDYYKFEEVFSKLKERPDMVFNFDVEIYVCNNDDINKKRFEKRVFEIICKKFNHNKMIVVARDITEIREIKLYRKIKESFIEIQKNIESINEIKGYFNG